MRKRITFSLPNELIEELKKISDETMIPQARLVEQAIKNIITEHKKES